MEEQSLRRGHAGVIWGASGHPLGALWGASAWESSGGHLEGLRLRRHLGSIRRSDLRNDNASQRKCKSVLYLLISRRVFEGRCHQVV